MRKLLISISSNSYITTLRLKDEEDARISIVTLAEIAKKSGYSIAKTKTPFILDIFKRKLGLIKEYIGIIAYEDSAKDYKMVLGNTDALRILDFLKDNPDFKVV